MPAEFWSAAERTAKSRLETGEDGVRGGREARSISIGAS